ncbi:endolytic transglycosylase MltG [Phocicoccus pinnipedialis]|uniref:Endolytic murein transglycosylase n=1 Tax=Phocicoccus pinnipedialis TaxID=110845 RepID=A0A6V7REJ1_9BACL|nr:endolytic transglycosylase MltG [Jeotgalicoccus pinnipedialis]MBP1939230.1 UPF0755 protein [Jeotgalicoccus pinnipedialis]CAD2076214.1 putative aminodeoxychorismate lyase [Jeotgalicoccus pinnipedialis]
MKKNDDVRFSKNVSSYLSLFIVSILAVVLIVLAISGFIYVKSGSKPLNPDSEEVVQVEIISGASSSDISDMLEESGIIKNSFLFQMYLRLNSISNYQAGQYNLSPSMDFETISKTLETGIIYEEVVYKLTIPEGYTIDEIGDTIENTLPVKKEVFINKIQDKEYMKQLIEDYPDMLTDEILDEDIKYPLEGYLFPATYDITEEEPSMDKLIRQMLDATKINTYNLYKSVDEYNINIEGNNETLTFHQFLTLASLVEEEATSLADRAKITSVFLNRLALEPSMPLQTDPTVLYAQGKHKDVVLYEDLEVNDPFNTYQHRGLTPGPIAGPGTESVQSILNPSNTNYYYFLADKNGVNHFSETLEEHEEKREKYINAD